MSTAFASVADGPLGKVAFVLLALLVLVFAAYLLRDKGNPELTATLQEYAAQRDYGLWVKPIAGLRCLIPGSNIGDIVKLTGSRNGAAFEVSFGDYSSSADGPWEKSTFFHCSPTWLPDKSGITITVGHPRQSRLYSNPEPSLVRHGVHVYVSPPELVSAFDGPSADKLLEDFARNGFACNGWGKYGKTKPSINISINGWCTDLAVLDATIDVLTRLCGLR